MSDIRIHITNTTARNKGIFHGIWIDATLPVDEMQKAVDKMLEASPVENAESWVIGDYEGFLWYKLNEYESLQNAHDAAIFIKKHGALGAALLNKMTANEAKAAIKEHYFGCYKSLADFARDLRKNEVSAIPASISKYINYEQMARELKLKGSIYTIEMGHEEVHVFFKSQINEQS
jgi:antirestriction protein